MFPDTSKIKSFFLAFFLILPASLPYWAHYLVYPDNNAPTGFVIYDFAYYMACAREYFDSAQFHFTYGNPFSYLYDTPKIYFQPLTFIMGLLWYWTQWEPGIVFQLTGLVAAVFCARIAILLYREYVGLESWAHKLGLVLFFWGGGVLALTGMYDALIQGPSDAGIFKYDPFGGFWCLNFGRNLVFPMEAFYHGLFFLCILLVLKARFKWSFLVLLMVSISHPFTGIEQILVLIAFTLIERFFIQNREIPAWFVFACLLVLGFHCLYYIVFLNSFPEHRQVTSQWVLPWFFRLQHMIPAYILVLFPALWSLRRLDLARSYFALSRNRLLLIWFIVAFLLANHEFALSPIQPLHFTRGYIWIPLFFMGSASLVSLLLYVKSNFSRVTAWLCIVLLAVFFLMDNTLWLNSFFFSRSKPRQSSWELRISPQQREILDWLNTRPDRNLVVISQDIVLSYMITTYTPFRSWYSHLHITPHEKRRLRELKALFSEDQFLHIWDNIPVLVIYLFDHSRIRHIKPAWMKDRKVVKVFENSAFAAFGVGDVFSKPQDPNGRR